MLTLYQASSDNGEIEFLVATNEDEQWVIDMAMAKWGVEVSINQFIEEYELIPCFDLFNLREDAFYIRD